jgi:hypothetical protein
MQYFSLNADRTRYDSTSNDRALLVMSHENIAGTLVFMHPNRQTNAAAGRVVRLKSSRRKWNPMTWR